MTQPTPKARLVITALFVDQQSPAEVAARYGVHRAWVYKLKARYEAEGDTALAPRSRRPHTSPGALPGEVVEHIVRLRKELTGAGLDAGPDTIAWHLDHHHGLRVARSTVSRHLAAAGLVAPEPRKRPRSSYLRFEAAMPNETWQSDFTHYPLADGTTAEVISWLDDCTRYALHVSAHPRITTPIAVATFRDAVARHGIPASTLTDNGMLYTVRLSGGRGGRNAFEDELRRRHIVQKNSRPAHPTTCGKAERFQQTLKKWLRAQPDQPATITSCTHCSTSSSTSTTTADPTGHCPTGGPRRRSTTPYPKRCRPGHRPEHTRPGPPRPRRQGRVGHPAPQQPPAPHRCRPNPRRNLRHPARPGPPDPRRERRHRRAPARPDPRPHPRLSAHRRP